jgi:copper transport protein
LSGLSVTVLFLAGTVGRALAHAELIRSSPSAGERLTQPPERITLWFDEELDTRGSGFQVFDADERPIAGSEGGVDLTDPDHASMVVRLSPLPEGVYTVRWRALTPDDQGVTEGEFDFIVGDAEPRPRPAPAANVWWPVGAVALVVAMIAFGLAVRRRSADHR